MKSYLKNCHLARFQNKIQKVCLRRFPLSRFLAKALRENKIDVDRFPESFSLFSRECIVRSRRSLVGSVRKPKVQTQAISSQHFLGKYSESK